MRWNDEQRELRDLMVRLGERAGADHRERESRGEFSWDGWKLLREAGLFGLPFAETSGGLGRDLPTTMYVLEGLGHACRDPGLPFSACTHMVSTGVPLSRFAGADLRRRYLPEVCAGTMIGAHAITEPAGGSDVTRMLTTAVADGDDFVLNGSKAFVSNGPIADLVVVYARTGRPGNPASITPFLVRRDTPGLTVGGPIGKMGLRTAPLSELYLDDVRVPRSHALGAVGAGLLVLDAVMRWEILCGFAISLGEMRHRLERCVEHARSRVQFGATIGSHQAVSHRLVDMRIDVETSAKWLYDTADRMVAGKDVATDVAMTKLVVSESNVRSALAAVQLFGGSGYTTELGIEEGLRTAVAGTIYSGTSEIQRQRVAVLMGLDRPVRGAPAEG